MEFVMSNSPANVHCYKCLIVEAYLTFCNICHWLLSFRDFCKFFYVRCVNNDYVPVNLLKIMFLVKYFFSEIYEEVVA